jgi:hypothetical protein
MDDRELKSGKWQNVTVDKLKFCGFFWGYIDLFDDILCLGFEGALGRTLKVGNFD